MALVPNVDTLPFSLCSPGSSLQGRGHSNVLFPRQIQAGWPPRPPPTGCPRRWACLGVQLPKTRKLNKNLLFALWHDGMSDPQPSHPQEPLAGGLNPARTCSENQTGHAPDSFHLSPGQKWGTLNKPSLVQPHICQSGPAFQDPEAQGTL